MNEIWPLHLKENLVNLKNKNTVFSLSASDVKFMPCILSLGHIGDVIIYNTTKYKFNMPTLNPLMFLS